SLALVVIGNTLMSLGFGFTFTLTIDLVIGAAPPERAGAASALAETGAELGGALGLAVLGSLGIAVYRSQMVAAMPPGISPEVVHAVQETLGGAVAAAGQLPGSLGATVLHLAHAAFIQGLHLTALIGAVVMIGLAILTAVMLRRVGVGAESEGQPDPKPDGLVAVRVCVE
ncbi:MAG: MFS transporter, partial [Chloroflexota bacterium]